MGGLKCHYRPVANALSNWKILKEVHFWPGIQFLCYNFKRCFSQICYLIFARGMLIEYHNNNKHKTTAQATTWTVKYSGDLNTGKSKIGMVKSGLGCHMVQYSNGAYIPNKKVLCSDGYLNTSLVFKRCDHSCDQVHLNIRIV